MTLHLGRAYPAAANILARAQYIEARRLLAGIGRLILVIIVILVIIGVLLGVGLSRMFRRRRRR